MQFEELCIEAMLSLSAIFTVVMIGLSLFIFEEAKLKEEREGKSGMLDDTADEVFLGVLMGLPFYCVLVE